MVVVGYKRVVFKLENSNDEVKGYSVYVAEPFGDKEKEAFGHKTDKIFLSDKKFLEHRIDKLYEEERPFNLLYNRYGKIETLQVL